MSDLSLKALSNNEIADYLDQHSAKIAPRDLEFCSSLISSARRGKMTDKQRYWLEKMAERIDQPQQTERVKTPVGDLSGVMALFDGVRKHLKAPAVVISPDDPREGRTREWRLSVAGPTARAPGTINVVQKDADRGVWFGRILLDGQFEASPREPTPDDLVPFLQRFAANPAKVAAEYGKLNGRCCFCDRALTDERSTAVGYGATCAKNWSLPYPSFSEARAKVSEDLFAA